MPPSARLAEWREDYAKMEEMFFGRQLSFEEVLTIIERFEEQFNLG